MYNFEELKKIYKGKNVLVTGHTGFKGTYLCTLLASLGAKTYGYALKPEKKSLYVWQKKRIKLVEEEVLADIRNYDKLENFVKKVMPDFVFHLAAQPLVLKSYEEPRLTYETNVMGTVNLFEALREVYESKNNKNQKHLPISILNVTTDKVYENDDKIDYAFNENDKLCGSDPYANSKSCSEIVTYSYKKSFFQDKEKYRISTARAGNVIGGGDMSENRIIPDCVRAIIDNNDMIIRNPMSIRPYQYVMEPLIMYLNIVAYQYKDAKYEGNYNIGPDKKSSINTKTLVTKFIDEWYKDDKVNKIKIVCEEKNNITCKKYESKFLRLDNSLIKKQFGYKEIWSIDEAIVETVKHYKELLKQEC